MGALTNEIDLTFSNEIDQIIPALIEAKKEFPKITKDAQGHNYKYTDLPSLLELETFLLDKRVVILQPPASTTVQTILVHESGQWIRGSLRITTEVMDTSGHKNPAQAFGSTITYLRRYCLEGTIAVAGTKDDDAASHTGSANGTRNGTTGAISEKQLKRLYAIATDSRWNVAQVTRFVHDNFKKTPAEICWGDEYDKICKYFENNVNPDPR